MRAHYPNGARADAGTSRHSTTCCVAGGSRGAAAQAGRGSTDPPASAGRGRHGGSGWSQVTVSRAQSHAAPRITVRREGAHRGVGGAVSVSVRGVRAPGGAQGQGALQSAVPARGRSWRPHPHPYTFPVRTLHVAGWSVQAPRCCGSPVCPPRWMPAGAEPNHNKARKDGAGDRPPPPPTTATFPPRTAPLQRDITRTTAGSAEQVALQCTLCRTHAPHSQAGSELPNPSDSTPLPRHRSSATVNSMWLRGDTRVTSNSDGCSALATA